MRVWGQIGFSLGCRDNLTVSETQFNREIVDPKLASQFDQIFIKLADKSGQAQSSSKSGPELIICV